MLIPVEITSGGSENDRSRKALLTLAYRSVPTGPSFGARGTGVIRVL